MQTVLDAPFDKLDRRNGTGASSMEDAWLDENSTAHENQWSSAQTTFYPDDEDVPSHRVSFYQRLYRKHNGWGEEGRRGDIRETGRMNDAETFCVVLELPDRQRDRVLDIIQDIDMSANRFGGKRYEKILLAVCSLVSDQALSNKDNPSIDDRLVLTDEFRALMEANDLGSREHSRIRQQIREKTEYF